MGDYSVMCTVTGLPITGNQIVVGFEVEPYRFDTDRNRYVPLSWPVEGKYDMGGGIEELDLSPNVALIHKEVWENAEIYWHRMNRKSGPDFLDTARILEEAKRRMKMETRLFLPDQKHQWTLADYVYGEIFHRESDTDESLTLRNMMDSKNGNVTNLPESLCFIHRSSFGQIVAEKIINGWTEEDSLTLYRLVCLYSGQMMTGKHIAPSNQPHVEQYPDYKQRIKVRRFASGLATRLQKELMK